MARIRSIKPEFWVSEQIVECSPIARLLFIAMWNFADDGGRLAAKLKALKMSAFPGDDITTTELASWVQELIDNDLVMPYVVDSQEYWQITGWGKHQKIDRPTYRHPPPPLEEHSPTSRRALDEHSTRPRSGMETRGLEGSGVESNRVETRGVDAREAEGSSPSSPTNGAGTTSPKSVLTDEEERAALALADSVAKLWNEKLPELQTAKPAAKWSQKRVDGYLSVVRDQGYVPSLEEWAEVFTCMRESDFLLGKTPTAFKPDLTWVLNPERVVEILNGKYRMHQP